MIQFLCQSPLSFSVSRFLSFEDPCAKVLGLCLETIWGTIVRLVIGISRARAHEQRIDKKSRPVSKRTPANAGHSTHSEKEQILQSPEIECNCQNHRVMQRGCPMTEAPDPVNK
jgi:hypothetical protein